MKEWLPKLRLKMKYKTTRLNWCERHVIETLLTWSFV